MRSNVKLRCLLLLSSLSLPLGCASASGEAGEDDASEEVATSEDGLHATSPTVTLARSATLFGGTRTAFEFRVRTRNGSPIATFDVEHTKLFHLIVVSRDLSYFTHVHPTYLGQGRFRIDWTPPSPEDDYALYAQFRPQGAPSLSTVRFNLHVPSNVMKASVPVTASTAPVTSGFSRLTVHPPTGGYKTGDNNFHFAVTDTRTNAPAQLGTFLGARAHVIAVKAGAADRVFLHGHDMGSQSAGTTGGGHGTPPASPGPASAGALSFDLKLAEPGLYRLWVQYNHGGRDVTQFVTVNVATSTAPTCDYGTPGWVGRSVQECATVMAACIPGTTWFSNTCGCGCR